MRKLILILFTATMAFAGRDRWTFANDSSDTLEFSIWNAGGTYSHAEIALPGDKVTIYGPPEGGVYFVYADSHTKNAPLPWTSNGTDSANRPGEHRVWYVYDAAPPPNQGINFREYFPTLTPEDSDSTSYLTIFIMGMGLAATVKLVRVGLRWSRVLLADQDGG